MQRNWTRIVIFDCDGVMFDTRKANTAYYNHILAHFGKPPMTAVQFEYTHMHTVDESLSFLFETPQQKARADAYRRRMSYAPFLDHMIIEPHLKPLLQKIRPTIPTAVATNRTDTMAGVLERFDLAGEFDMVVTASDVQHPKPHPEALIKILHQFCLDPHQALYIGDSKVDETAALAADVPFVAYRNRSLNARQHITSLKEIDILLTDAGA